MFYCFFIIVVSGDKIFNLLIILFYDVNFMKKWFFILLCLLIKLYIIILRFFNNINNLLNYNYYEKNYLEMYKKIILYWLIRLLVKYCKLKFNLMWG